jgi:hypothetical protein
VERRRYAWEGDEWIMQRKGIERGTQYKGGE